MEIIYSRLGEKADEVIKRLVATGSEEILVVTSDREIAMFAARRGKGTIASAEFAARLDRIAAGKWPADAAGDEEAETDRTGGKTKGSRPPPLQTETGCTRPDKKTLKKGWLLRGLYRPR